MKTTTTRRDFLKTTITAGLAISPTSLLIGGEGQPTGSSPNNTVRIGVVGLGGIDVVGGGGRTRPPAHRQLAANSGCNCWHMRNVDKNNAKSKHPREFNPKN